MEPEFDRPVDVRVAAVSVPGGLRRVFPPPRRRPNLFAVLLRWRVEMVGTLGAGAIAHGTGWRTTAAVALGLLLTAVVTGPGRRVLRCAVQTLAVPHRVRSALRQAGVSDIAGRLPWLLVAYPVGIDAVLVSVVLRAGTTVDDVIDAAPLIRAACGAARVDVREVGERADRLQVVVHRPRWGLLGR